MTEIIQGGLALCIVTVALVSLVFPWTFSTRCSRQLVHLPLSLFLLYPAYESTMSPETNIRIDLLFLQPLIGLVGLCYAVKLILLLILLSRTMDKTETEEAGPSEIHSAPCADNEQQTAGMDKANQKLAHLLPKSSHDQKSTRQNRL